MDDVGVLSSIFGIGFAPVIGIPASTLLLFFFLRLMVNDS